MDHPTDPVPGGHTAASRRALRRRLRDAWVGACAVLLLAALMAQPTALAAEGEPPKFNLNPVADPVVRADAVFFARKVTAWRQGQTSWLLLEGDAGFSVGVYGFSAAAAAVRIETEERPGRTVRHLSIYLDQARHLRGTGPVSAEADRLLVTASTSGGVQVRNDLFVELDEAPRHALVTAAEARMRRHQESLARVSIGMPDEPLFDPALFDTRFVEQYEPRPQMRITPLTEEPDRPEPDAAAAVTEPSTMPQPVPGTPGKPSVAEAPSPDEPEAAPIVEAPPVADDRVLPTTGTVSLVADRVVYDPGDEESSVMLIGNVRLFYDDFRKDRQVSLQAERVVVFLESGESAGPVAPSSVDAGDVRGVYLEDNVIVTDLNYTVRAPRVYYDVRENKAVLLEAVLYSFDATRQLPLYMRAQTVRQTSASSFEADDVQLTTSEFAEPHFAIGAARITLDQEPVEGGGVSNKVTATDTTLRVKDTPFFVWPYLEGRPGDVPLKRVKAGYDSDTGVEIETTWDVFALAGREAPDGVELLANADWLGDHGPGVGAELEYGLENMFGEARTYLLLDDDGTDEIGSRNDVEQDGGTRGFFKWQHRQYLQNGSELSIESAYVSDETFLEEFFREEAYEAKEYETSIYWKTQEDDQALTFLTRYDLTDFTPQLTTLQAPGYTVDKAPELAYYRTGTSFWDDKLTWSSENRAGFVRIQPGEDTPADRGFSNAQSQTLFGIPNTTSFEDAVFGSGVPDEWVFRADTRQEVSAPMRLGDFNVVPYAVGRITAYDEDFSAFAGEDEKVRAWGSLGTRVSTRLSKTTAVQNRLLDVDGIRHIIEPSVDVFFSGSSVDSDDLPVYDNDIESIQEGEGVRLGLTNTWQTHRGSGARRRSVDWIVLRTDVVFNDNDDDVEANIGRFFEQRPEYALGGDHIYSELLWMVTDTLGLAGELTHSLEDDRVVQWRFGGTLQHTPRFSSFVRYDEIDALDSQLLTYGFRYVLTVKYEMGFQQRIDFEREDSESIDLWLERRVPKWRVRLTASVDDIDDNQTIGISLIPEGFGGGPSPLLR
jgi:hypothetical protein